MRYTAILIMAFILFLKFPGPVHGAVPADERAALIALYNGTNGDNWTDKDGWKGNNNEADGFSQTGSEGTWHGITVEGNHVMTIDLKSNNLSGNIPGELGDLSSLRYLYLRDNRLTGSIPPELGKLSNLVHLYLYRNELEGDIPSELGNLSNLKILHLHSNKLSGSIPRALGNLLNLTKLHLRSNQYLTGTIPPGFGDLEKLEELYLWGCDLSGSIPTQLGNLKALKVLQLHENKLTGSIPGELGGLPELVELSLNSNALTDNIPPELGTLSKLKNLYLQKNKLSEPIPEELGNLLTLKELLLNANRLTGDIPPEIKSLDGLSNNLCDFRWNALYTEDETIKEFLEKKQVGGEWESTQTIAPVEVAARPASPTSIEVSWKPITYSYDPGGYRVYCGITPGGPYTLSSTTEYKWNSHLEVTGLTPLTCCYYFVVETLTLAHNDNENEVISEYSAEVSAETPGPDKTVSGKVIDSVTGLGVPDVTLTFPPTNEFEKTGPGGTYRHAVGYNWTGHVVPTKTGYRFEPRDILLPNVTEDLEVEAFTATLFTPSISGRVVNAFDDGVEGVKLTFTSHSGKRGYVTTDSVTGHYSYPVSYGWSGSVEPGKDQLKFEPEERKIDPITENKEQDFQLKVTLSLKAERKEERTFLVKRDFAEIVVTVVLVGDPRVQKYVVYRKDGEGAFKARDGAINTPDLNNETPYIYRDKYLDKNVPYTYQIRAVAADGDEIGVSKTETI